MKKTIVLLLFVVLTSLMISIVVGEYIVRGVMPQITYKQAKIVGLRVYEKSDYLPFTLKPNLETNHLGYTREFDHKLRINNLGFRGADTTEAKPEGVTRILALGDSMTFGWGVEDNQTWPYLTGEGLNDPKLNLGRNIEVINAGFADGYSPDSYYAFLVKQGLKLEPDILLLTLFPYNDVPDLLEMEWETDERGYPVKVTSMDKAIKDGYQTWRYKTEWKYEVPILRNSQVAMLLFQALERNSPKTVDLIRKILNVQDPPNRTNQIEVSECLYKNLCDQKFNKPLEQINFLLTGFRDLAAQRNIKLLVVMMPAPDQVKPIAEKIGPRKEEELAGEVIDEQPQKMLREFMDQNGIDYVDLLPALIDANWKSYFYGRDGHLAPTGTKRVAEVITKSITAKVIPAMVNP